MNSVNIIGRVTANPKTEILSTGSSVSIFSIAYNTQYTNKTTGEIKKKVQFFPVKIWERLNLINFLCKGTKIAVSGELARDTWMDGDENKDLIYILASEITLLSKPNNQS